METDKVKDRMNKLRVQIADLRYRYHVLNDPGVTDDVYDSLAKELRKWESKYPQLAGQGVDLDRVAGKPQEKFAKVPHKIRMLSLNDVFSKEELKDWENRVNKLLNNSSGAESPEFFAEVKFDGLAVSLIYEKGHFVRGATRGDGLVGEDITQNLKTIISIPIVLQEPFPEYLEVRGEALMLRNVLNGLNDKLRKEGKPLFANTRNAAAGSLRQLNPNLTAQRRLEFMAYDIAEMSGKPIKNHSDKHRLLRFWGFKVDKHECKSSEMENIEKFIDEISELRNKFDYGTDGVVVSVNELKLQETLGVVGKAPRFMVAYKYPAEKATTIISDIKVSVGRTGVMTPLAIFKPTLVAGSVISKATLHNLDQIERLDVRIGDTVVIQKAGDVIPEVVEVMPKLRTGKEKRFKMPDKCPVCGEATEKRSQGEKGKVSVAYYCTNSKCPAKNKRFMQHFVSVLEIYSIGPKILDRLQAEGLISDAADIFKLQEADIGGLERFGEKSAENIINSIRSHKEILLPKFIFALGILHVGEQTSEDLAKHFKSLDKLASAPLEEIARVENIGPVVAKSAFDYFRDPQNEKFISKLFKYGVKVKKYETFSVSPKLEGKNFVLTGTLVSLGREEAKKKIKDLGGRVVSSISKSTDFLVVGDSPGSKFEKAKKLGISVLNEMDFLRMVE